MTTTVQSANSIHDDLGTPSQAPPEDVIGDGVGGAGTSAPSRTSLTVSESSATDAAPQLEPPGAVAGAGAQAVAATWQSGQVTALWSIDEVRNAWMHVAAIGWRKLYNGRDGAFQALVALGSQARQTGRSINFREEADGMVYEIYLW